jgi:hypothetical protein
LLLSAFVRNIGWADSQRQARDRHWVRCEQLVSALPPGLAGAYRILQFDLALRYSSTGRFRDIFLGIEQPPVLWIAPWLLADAQPEHPTDRVEEEQRLFATSVLLVAREQLVMALLDRDSFAANDQLALAVHLSERIAAELTAISAGSRWLDCAAVAPSCQRPVDAAPEAHLVSPWERPMQLLATVTQEAAGLRVPAAPLGRMIELLAAGFEVRRQLATLHADLMRGCPTYPIALIARAARMPLDPWPPAEAVLGAMVLTRSVPAVLQASLDRLEEARGLAEELELPTFVGFMGDAAATVADQLDRSDRPAATRSRPALPLITLWEPTVPTAVAMARRFLLADLTFSEACERHREGMFGEPEVVSRFPAGLILEILASTGESVTAAVDTFLRDTVGNGFRYYQHPRSGVDTDTIGVYLRLLRIASGGEQNLADAQDVLARLERRVERSRAVPVWLRRDDEDSQPVIDLGEDCGTVAAHLLLGVGSARGARHDHIFDVGARTLFERILQVRLGANVNYPLAFALAAYLRLAAVAAERPGLTEIAGAVRSELGAEVERRCRYSARTAQAAALISLACLDAGRPDLLDTAWRATILKQQRFDGSWNGEPFAAAPNRGNAITWYSSSTMTSALAYQALARWSCVDR